jgi:hypothetical protein
MGGSYERESGCPDSRWVFSRGTDCQGTAGLPIADRKNLGESTQVKNDLER